MNFSEAQMYLVHTPGELEGGIFNDGSVGCDSKTGDGPGLSWRGVDGLWKGGLIFGSQSGGYCNGLFGSFLSLGQELVSDINKTASFYQGGLFHREFLISIPGRFLMIPMRLSLTVLRYFSVLILLLIRNIYFSVMVISMKELKQ